MTQYRVPIASKDWHILSTCATVLKIFIEFAATLWILDYFPNAPIKTICCIFFLVAVTGCAISSCVVWNVRKLYYLLPPAAEPNVSAWELEQNKTVVISKAA